MKLATWRREDTIIWSPSEKIVICQMSKPEPSNSLVQYEELRSIDLTNDILARADLIAAAPELLSALYDTIEIIRAVVDNGSFTSDWRATVERGFEALRKAGVEQNLSPLRSK